MKSSKLVMNMNCLHSSCSLPFILTHEGGNSALEQSSDKSCTFFFTHSFIALIAFFSVSLSPGKSWTQMRERSVCRKWNNTLDVNCVPSHARSNFLSHVYFKLNDMLSRESLTSGEHSGASSSRHTVWSWRGREGERENKMCLRRRHAALNRK